LNAITPLGGHLSPVAILYSNAAQKNDQKNPKKKHTSEAINSIILICIEFVVFLPCWPEFLSRDTSRHHIKVIVIINIADTCTQPVLLVIKLAIVISIPLVSTIIISNDSIIGQGLLVTI